MGDTGGGKTQLIIQQVLQIQERHEVAIIHDPEREYTPRFYKPERGDVILYPYDKRMPFWNIGDEIRSPAEAAAVAASLFPDRPNQDPFFWETSRKIFAHMLTFKPTPRQLVQWMSNPEEIDRLVEGTPYKAMITRESPDQRNGVIGSLNRVADALSVLPSEEEGNGRWSTLEWAKTRKGYLFFPGTNMTRDLLMPLYSLWLDLLVMRTQDEGEEEKLPRVWFILDEVGLLQKLPKLHDAITRNRKSNNPIVLGFQGRSQLRKHYGIDAEVMFSQPATKIFLRTSEPESAKWISDTIGDVEIEQVRESRTSENSSRYRQSRSRQFERRIEPLVLPSEIMGLEDRRGYLKFGNAVVQLSFPYVEVPKTQPAIIERVIETPPPELPKAAAAAAGANGSPKPNGTWTRRQGNSARVSPGESRRTQRDAPQKALLRIETMLTISKPLSAGQARAYHQEEFSNARENYYSEGERIIGEWHGKLAAKWGLQGEVREEHFRRLSDGQHPMTGEQLVRYQTARQYVNEDGETVKAMEHRAGWDATFSAPKSVSLTALVGGDERVREAHQASVGVALDEMERYVQARLGGNLPAETTGNWVAARFEHDSARPVDGYAAPQLHTHVVFFNLTETENGETRPLQPQELYRTQQYATAVYRSELAHRLERLGYEIEHGKSGQPEIKGYIREYLDASSPRRKQIEEHLAEENRSGAAAAQIAAHQTREAKLELSHDEMQRRHEEMASRFGNQPERVIAAARTRAHEIGSNRGKQDCSCGG